MGIPAAEGKNQQGRGRLQPVALLLPSVSNGGVAVSGQGPRPGPENLSSRPTWPRFSEQESHTHLPTCFPRIRGRSDSLEFRLSPVDPSAAALASQVKVLAARPLLKSLFETPMGNPAQHAVFPDPQVLCSLTLVLS